MGGLLVREVPAGPGGSPDPARGVAVADFGTVSPGHAGASMGAMAELR